MTVVKNNKINNLNLTIYYDFEIYDSHYDGSYLILSYEGFIVDTVIQLLLKNKFSKETTLILTIDKNKEIDGALFYLKNKDNIYALSIKGFDNGLDFVVFDVFEIIDYYLNNNYVIKCSSPETIEIIPEIIYQRIDSLLDDLNYVVKDSSYDKIKTNSLINLNDLTYGMFEKSIENIEYHEIIDKYLKKYNRKCAETNFYKFMYEYTTKYIEEGYSYNNCNLYSLAIEAYLSENFDNYIPSGFVREPHLLKGSAYERFEEALLEYLNINVNNYDIDGFVQEAWNWHQNPRDWVYFLELHQFDFKYDRSVFNPNRLEGFPKVLDEFKKL